MNRIRDYQRKKRFRSFFGVGANSHDIARDAVDEHASDEVEETVLRHEFWEKMGAFLDRLPEGEREAFTLRFMEQFSLREIALILKKKESTIKTQLYRAIRKFKKNPVTI